METTAYDKQVKQLLDNMHADEVAIISVREIAGNKVQFEVAERITGLTPSGNSLVGDFNKSDERFSQRRPRRAWLSAEPVDARRLLPQFTSQINSALESDKPIFIGAMNPEVVDGRKIKIQITEGHMPRNDWEEGNLKKSAKQDGEGNYLLKGGNLIFTRATVVANEANHTVIQHDSTTTDPGSANYIVREGNMDQSEIVDESESGEEQQQPEEMPEAEEVE